MPEVLTFKIEDFEGPLDLLLYLVGKNKMNLYDVNIMELIEQYTAAIREMQHCGNGCIRERNRSWIVFLERMVNSTASFLSASSPAPFFLSLTPAPETFPFSFLSQPASFLQNISDK